MTEQFLKSIKNPPGEFTPIPFWFWNDEPDEGKLRRQLTDFLDKGVEGIVLHPRIGIPREIPYLSEPFFRTVRFVVQTAKQLGMKVVLYDEGMYPSGSAHGLVVAEEAEYASKGVRLSDSGTKGQVITRFSDGKYLVYGFTGGTIRGIHYGEDDGEAGAPLSADILDPKAVDAFIRLTHERYYQELQEYFGNTVIAFFTDEPCPLGRNAGGFREWAPGMEAEIIAENGSLEELEALFTGGENRTTQIYHRLIKRRLRETYYARLSGWCESHGISLMGHPAASDDVAEEFYFQIPGQDLIMRRVAPETGGIREPDSVQAKLPADIARYLGRRRNANECFGVCNRQNIPWYFTGCDMKWYINWLGIRGVNLFVPHAFYYSLADQRKEERPPDVGPHNIWWRHYRLFSDYMKRISYLMTDSESLAGVAVLCDNNRVPAEEVAGLYEHQVGFHYLPAALLEKSEVRDGRLCVGGCRFDVVLDLYGYGTLDGYAKYLSGVRIVEEAATLYPGNGSAAADESGVDTAGPERESREDYRTVATEGSCPCLRAVHMKKAGVSWYLFSNEGEEPIETKVWIRESGEGKRPFMIRLWDAALEDVDIENTDGCTGRGPEQKRSENSSFCIGLKLERCEMKLLLLLDQSQADLVKACRTESAAVKAGEEVFLGDWTDKLQPVDEKKNTVIYRCTCMIPEERVLTGEEYFTVRGEEMAECVCNGTFAGVSFYGPHRFRIGQLLQKGENEIRLMFTGNAVNLYGNVKAPFGPDGSAPAKCPSAKCQ
ncbi:MAG: hypothetical protein NC517_12485 [Firmicutes bacterium]|nr:hypothetical protein [Bacillota bacterium]